MKKEHLFLPLIVTICCGPSPSIAGPNIIGTEKDEKNLARESSGGLRHGISNPLNIGESFRRLKNSKVAKLHFLPAENSQTENESTYQGTKASKASTTKESKGGTVQSTPFTTSTNSMIQNTPQQSTKAADFSNSAAPNDSMIGGNFGQPAKVSKKGGKAFASSPDSGNNSMIKNMQNTSKNTKNSNDNRNNSMIKGKNTNNSSGTKASKNGNTPYKTVKQVKSYPNSAAADEIIIDEYFTTVDEVPTQEDDDDSTVNPDLMFQNAEALTQLTPEEATTLVNEIESILQLALENTDTESNVEDEPVTEDSNLFVDGGNTVQLEAETESPLFSELNAPPPLQSQPDENEYYYQSQPNENDYYYYYEYEYYD
jgi:hypothetical protein